MKRYIFLPLLLCITGGMVCGQQLFTSSLYDMQGNFHNPSLAGVQKHGMVGATYRAMWDGIAGGPQTATVFGSGYIPSVKLGLGGYVYSDKTGPTTRTGVQTSFAYHIPLKNESSFSIGIEARVQQFSYDRAKLQESLGSIDPVIGSAENRIKGDAGLGFSYTSKKFQLGASVSQLIQSKLDVYSGALTRSQEGRLYRHYYFHGQYNWQVDENTVISPNALAIYLPNAPTELQAGARVEHNKTFWWGLAYRARQSWLISAGLRIKESFTVGYCFDIYRTPLSVFDRGSNEHEVILRFDFLK